MKPVAAILFSMILAMACHDPPPKHDPEVKPESTITPKLSEGFHQQTHPLSLKFCKKTVPICDGPSTPLRKRSTGLKAASGIKI